MLLLLQRNVNIAWLMILSIAVFASNCLISDRTHRFSRQLINNSSNYQCQPQPSTCNYFNYYGAKVINNRTTLLRAGFCATYNEHTRLVAFSACPFIQSNGNYPMSKEECNSWYIQLPDNVSKLSDFMCGPLNRKGRVCSECKDGFGPALVSYGFLIQCSNCTDSGWYGILLYMFLEIVPVTVFYFVVILIFQINITSAPMTCYIMYSQLVPLWWNFAFSGEDVRVSRQMFVLNHLSEFLRSSS